MIAGTVSLLLPVMSVFFKDVSENNPVKQGDVEALLAPYGLTIPPSESADYTLLLAGVHEVAERISALPDYQPVPDTTRFPRQNVRRPSAATEQELGAAWAHRFLIQGDEHAQSAVRSKKVCLKDCIAVAGVPQFFGSDAFPPWTPSTDATVVTRLLEAGADMVGTATCEHFCNSTASFTSAQGTIHNPHAVGYSAGGSTSGGAALVASGSVDLCIGTDQGGSIRVPAALCGCVGLKPTHGLVPFTGFTSGDAIDDHAGPIARSVEEVAACLDIIAGYDGIDDRSLGAAHPGSYKFLEALRRNTTSDTPPLSGIRVGLLKEGFDCSDMRPEVAEAVLVAAHKLKQLGATVEQVSVPLHLEGPSIWTLQQRIAGSLGIMGRATGRRGLGLTEFEQARLPWTDSNFQRMFHSTKNTVINGMYLADKFPGLYGKVVNIGRQIRDSYQDVFATYDVLVMPTTPFVAPRHGTRNSVLKSFEPTMGLTSNTAVFNVTGHPALTIPIGVLPALDNAAVNLPVGMQIVGGHWKEDNVLKVGRAWEKAFGGFDGALSKDKAAQTPKMNNATFNHIEGRRKQETHHESSTEANRVTITA